MIIRQLHIFFKRIPYQLLIVAFVMCGCSVTKNLPKGESLYTGAKIEIVADSSLSKIEIKKLQTTLENYVKPLPNSKILGFPYKVWFYYLFGEPKKQKGFKSFFRKRFGEAPILASKSVTNANTKLLTNLLNNEGYFQSSASGELIEKNRKATAIYKATVMPRYYLDSINYTNDSSAIGKAFYMAQKNTFLKKGDPYRFELIANERVHINNELKQNGFYYFQPDYILAKADSTIGKRKVNLTLEIKPSTSQKARKSYFIRNVNVITDPVEPTFGDSLKGINNSIFYEGLTIYDKAGSYKPQIFSNAIGFRNGSTYNTKVQDISLSRLINLNGNFKFVKNTFDFVPRSDSALLDVNYYLTTLKTKTFDVEINGVTKSNNYSGTNLNLSWLNRNTFKGAELLKITAKTGLDFQLGGISKTLGPINTSRFGVEGSLSFPKFLIPFFSINTMKSQALPKTNITFAYDLFKRGGYYDLTSLRTSLSYNWTQNNTIEHSFTPVSINLVKAANISEAFVDDILTSDNPNTFFEILDNKLIVSSAYNVSYVPNISNRRHQFSVAGGVEVAGNIASLISKISTKSGPASTILGVAYAQYVRFDGDLRYTYTLKPNLKIANRFLVGYGIAYGNSLTLPSIKQYSAGGNNSIRAFAARSIGPGSFASSGDIGSQLLGSQMGDIKLEYSTELRAKFNKYINGAFFIDAGNVWIQHDKQAYGEEGVFGSKFYKQIAVGTGIGLRLDFSYLILRFDLATPVRKPYLEEGHRWVLKDFNITDKQWRSENLVLNIAVAYPF
jgi:outer membrane protein assembly factor BamA